MLYYVSNDTLHKEYGMSSELNFLKSTFLFNNVDDSSAEKLIKDLSILRHNFKRGEAIYSPESFFSMIGFITDGECLINRLNSDGGKVPMRKIGKYDSFGITAVFSGDEEFPTEVVATRECSVLFITKENLISLIETSPRIALNVIGFLTDRIAFLNKRVAELSSGDCENKLQRHLAILSERYPEREIPFNCKKTAESLNIGRASLYRSLKKLTDSGIIDYANNKIFIKDPDGLKGKSK